jgi:hypothetical protein
MPLREPVGALRRPMRSSVAVADGQPSEPLRQTATSAGGALPHPRLPGVMAARRVAAPRGELCTVVGTCRGLSGRLELGTRSRPERYSRAVAILWLTCVRVEGEDYSGQWLKRVTRAGQASRNLESSVAALKGRGTQQFTRRSKVGPASYPSWFTRWRTRRVRRLPGMCCPVGGDARVEDIAKGSPPFRIAPVPWRSSW